MPIENQRQKLFNPVIDRLVDRVAMTKENECGHSEPQPAMDIEDLMVEGRSTGICPYYAAKANLQAADIVLMPYSYMINS